MSDPTRRSPRPRILVVDDSVVVRRMVTDGLASDASLEVVGTAPNGRVALDKIPQCNPDLVTLDVEMPEMDGLETLAAIRASYPSLPVIMFSTLTERGAKVTVDALLLGANDYVTKPANVGSVPEAIQRIKEALVPRIHALCGSTPSGGGSAASTGGVTTPAAGHGSAAPTGARRTAPPVPRPTDRRPTNRVDAVVIGVSTGGPNALAEILPRLPADLPVPVLVVQHMPPMFTRLLAERFDATCQLKVTEAADRQPIRAGEILIAPGDLHLGVRRDGAQPVVELSKGPPENSCRPAADVLFRSACSYFGGNTLAVVLTGMGSDGQRGSEQIYAAGGRVLVQDEASSVVWGMPGAVVAAGVADHVLPLASMSTAIVKCAVAGRSATGVASVKVGS